MIPQFGRSELTARAVGSLLKWNSDVEQVLIVDDGSETKHVRDLQLLSFSRSEIIRLAENSGVTNAWNVALELVQTDFVIFLNNDVETTGPWCRLLTELLIDGRASITGVEWRVPDEIPLPLRLHFKLNRVLAGWCFALSRQDLLQQRGFDRSLRLYFSDTDLQLRLAQTSGSNALGIVSGLPLKHAAHQTTKHLATRAQQWHRDRKCFLAKWQSANGITE